MKTAALLLLLGGQPDDRLAEVERNTALLTAAPAVVARPNLNHAGLEWTWDGGRYRPVDPAWRYDEVSGQWWRYRAAPPAPVVATVPPVRMTFGVPGGACPPGRG